MSNWKAWRYDLPCPRHIRRGLKASRRCRTLVPSISHEPAINLLYNSALSERNPPNKITILHFTKYEIALQTVELHDSVEDSVREKTHSTVDIHVP